MKYKNATAFRQALETRIKSDHKPNEIPRVRKSIAFNQMMERLGKDWILKGGYAIQLRTQKARATQDVDLLANNISKGKIENSLRSSLNKDIGDYFQFQLSKPTTRSNNENNLCFPVTCLLDGRKFEQFHIDVGYADILVTPIDHFTPPQYLKFAGLKNSPIPTYSISQHIAEKVHAISRKRNKISSRVKDLIDIVLFAEISNGISSTKLSAAISATFSTYGDVIPEHFDKFPSTWSASYNRMAKDIDLRTSKFDESKIVASSFISPILHLTKNENKIWNARKGKWIAK